MWSIAMTFFREIIQNQVIVSAVCGWFVAQVLKTIIHTIITKEFVAERLVGSGGMPSSHSSTVCALSVATAYECGVGSCWIHRARQMFEREEGKALLRAWGLREDLIGVANCVLGYPAEDPAPKPRRESRIVKV